MDNSEKEVVREYTSTKPFSYGSENYVMKYFNNLKRRTVKRALAHSDVYTKHLKYLPKHLRLL